MGSHGDDASAESVVSSRATGCFRVVGLSPAGSYKKKLAAALAPAVLVHQWSRKYQPSLVKIGSRTQGSRPSREPPGTRASLSSVYRKSTVSADDRYPQETRYDHDNCSNLRHVCARLSFQTARGAFFPVPHTPPPSYCCCTRLFMARAAATKGTHEYANHHR